MKQERKITADRMGRQKTRLSVRWQLFFYDAVFYTVTALGLLAIYPSYVDNLSLIQMGIIAAIGFVCVFGARMLMNVYRQIWRYGSMQAYLRLIIADVIGGAVFVVFRSVQNVLRITLPRAMALLAINLLLAMSARIVYQYMYQSNLDLPVIKWARWFLNNFCGAEIELNEKPVWTNRIRVAIIGAGKVGVALSDELMRNPNAAYYPACFVDNVANKTGREINALPVIDENAGNLRSDLEEQGVQEVIIAIPGMDAERKKQLFEKYKSFGLKVKVYDYPAMQEAGKRTLRAFDIEELLFRSPRDFLDEQTRDYYKGKTVLITGGGGSIGSEICRQLARMQPKSIVVFDVYENGAYDLQQELRIKYGDELSLHVEITTMCDKQQLDMVFNRHRPDIVIHAAAHKHVPLMECNTVEAVKNNIFGTENVLGACAKYGVGRFMMVSTDKAVNPTNVMGATKRFCEMMVLNHPGDMLVSATRFGNVLGSAGSVIPLFRRQIQQGGPITVTDRRIIRYFMTIPEASQLVLTSGAIAKNRELFVLDMGKPVKIWELAESMIRVSGLVPYKDIEIVETGLRPGEKLYEELLIKGDSLMKTQNELIYIENQDAIAPEQIEFGLQALREAIATDDNDLTREVLRNVVPTFKKTDEINNDAAQSKEMRLAENKLYR